MNSTADSSSIFHHGIPDHPSDRGMVWNVTGLVESAGLMKMFGHGFTHTGMMSAVSIEIVWISTFGSLDTP